MTKYLSLPLSAFASARDSLDEARTEAKRGAARYQEDFAVFSVDLIGVYRAVAPIWEGPDDPQPGDSLNPPPIPPLLIASPRGALYSEKSADLDEIPF